jgi:lipoprotein NlpI
MRAPVAIWLAVCVLTLGAGVPTAQAPQDILDQAEEAFAAGEIEVSLERFDRLAALVPDVAPMLWQRGIALYELGRFDECAAQFKSHHAVNARDAENAAWHFLCLARAGSPEHARAALLPAGPDARVMRTAILDLFGGRRTPDDVLAEAGTVAIGQFYAHLYIGLYLEALGDPEAALAHLTAAASERYERYGGFMNVVAQVHLGRIKKQR